jgi:hypothetical protein
MSAAALAGCAQTGPDMSGRVYGQIVASGERARMGDYRTFSTARGCPTVSLPEITVADPPSHGRVAFGVGPAKFVDNKPVVHPCERASGAALIVYYVSDRGYRGLDGLAYRVRYSSGEVELIRKVLTVR